MSGKSAGKIATRSGGRCFYWLRKLRPGEAVLDHIVPQARGGTDRLENLVATCAECNWRKQDQSAAEFLRALYRNNRLSSAELSERLAALPSSP